MQKCCCALLEAILDAGWSGSCLRHGYVWYMRGSLSFCLVIRFGGFSFVCD